MTDWRSTKQNKQENQDLRGKIKNVFLSKLPHSKKIVYIYRLIKSWRVGQIYISLKNLTRKTKLYGEKKKFYFRKFAFKKYYL